MVQQEIQQKQVLYREGKVRPEDFESLHRLKTAIEEETEASCGRHGFTVFGLASLDEEPRCRSTHRRPHFTRFSPLPSLYAYQVVREIAEAINPGFGQKIFPMVASSNHCACPHSPSSFHA